MFKSVKRVIERVITSVEGFFMGLMKVVKSVIQSFKRLLKMFVPLLKGLCDKSVVTSVKG